MKNSNVLASGLAGSNTHKYGLLNKLNDQLLTHPRVGLWFTLDRKEAEEMLDACKGYLAAQGLKDLEGNFIIVDTDTREEVA